MKAELLFSYFQSDGGEEPLENPQEVLTECLEKFSTPDYIMEPGIFTQLKRYIKQYNTKNEIKKR